MPSTAANLISSLRPVARQRQHVTRPHVTRQHVTRQHVMLSVSLAVLACAGAALCPTEALAQPSESKVAAESLFNVGRTQMDQGQFAEACKSFAESQRLDSSVGTLLNLGLCNEKQGKVASAWVTYKEAAQAARNRGDSEREATALKLAGSLEPKLSKLSVSAAEAPPGLVVKRNGVQIAVLNVPLAIDPGEHEIEAAAPGFITQKLKVTIGAVSDSKTLQIPKLEPDPTATEVPPGGGEGTPPGGEGAGGGSAGGAATSPQGGGDGLKIAGFVVGGAGVVGLVLGGVFGGLASSTVSAAEEDATLCPNKVCTPAGREEIDGAETEALISTVGFIGGGVLLAGGVVMIAIGFAGDSDSAPATGSGLQLSPIVAITHESGFIGISGSY